VTGSPAGTETSAIVGLSEGVRGDAFRQNYAAPHGQIGAPSYNAMNSRAQASLSATR
jgi:hypothetical protein